LPPHELVVKIGAIMMIVRNISIPKGLCNGTRVQIVGFGKDIIHCRYIYGPRKGRQFELARFRFKFGGPDDPDRDRYGGVQWERLQFPLRPGFVLTTNKSQGQTLERVGLHLGESQCFSHGQFYVAMSRVKNGTNIRIFTLSNYRLVKNIVVRRIIDDIDIEQAKEYVKDFEAERAKEVRFFL
jgi:ATP-dependent DNA helicase PIF1